MIQRMIIFALSALDVFGKISTAPFCSLHSGASNYITHDTQLLGNLRPYIRFLHIHTVDDNTIHISVMGDVSPNLPNVFVFHSLSTNLIYLLVNL